MVLLQMIQLILRVLVLKTLHSLYFFKVLLQLVNSLLRPGSLFPDLELVIALILFPPLHVTLLFELLDPYLLLQVCHLLVQAVNHLFATFEHTFSGILF